MKQPSSKFSEMSPPFKAPQGEPLAPARVAATGDAPYGILGVVVAVAPGFAAGEPLSEVHPPTERHAKSAKLNLCDASSDTLNRSLCAR